MSYNTTEQYKTKKVIINYYLFVSEVVIAVIVWYMDIPLPMQSVPIMT